MATEFEELWLRPYGLQSLKYLLLALCNNNKNSQIPVLAWQLDSCLAPSGMARNCMQLHLQFLIPTSLPPRFTSALCSWHSNVCLLADSLILCIDNLDKDAGSGTSCKHCPSSPYRSLSFPSQTEATVTRPRPLPAHLFSGCCFSVISTPSPPPPAFFRIFLFIRQKNCVRR